MQITFKANTLIADMLSAYSFNRDLKLSVL